MEKTKYAGVYYRVSKDNPSERTYYVIYRRGGRDSKQIKEYVHEELTGCFE